MNILYQDDTLLIINKPAGMPVLPDGWDKDAPYLVKLLAQAYGKLWVVHRLDKVTSGVLAFARTAEAHRALSMQFEHHQAEKVYRAICTGAPAWDEHTARHRLRVNVGHSHRTVVDNGRGVPAETHFRVLQRYKEYGLLECAPATGRTHQIRVHAYALGHPLLGDTLYSVPTPATLRHGERKSDRQASAGPAVPQVGCAGGAGETELIARPALHAFALTLTHPVTHERLTFSTPPPADFGAALARLSK